MRCTANVCVCALTLHDKTTYFIWISTIVFWLCNKLTPCDNEKVFKTKTTGKRAIYFWVRAIRIKTQNYIIFIRFLMVFVPTFFHIFSLFFVVVVVLWRIFMVIYYCVLKNTSHYTPAVVWRNLIMI